MNGLLVIHLRIKFFYVYLENNDMNKMYNFKNSVFSEKKEFAWPYGLDNAKLVAFHITDTFSVFELFSCFGGWNELSLHNSTQTIIDNEIRNLSSFDLEDTPFVKSNLSKINYFNTLLISKWEEHMIVGSALFFVLEDLIIKKKNFLGVRYVIESAAPLVFSSKFYTTAVKILVITNLIQNNFRECCIGFKLFLTYQHFTFSLERNYEFNEQVLIAFLNLIKANCIEMQEILESYCKKYPPEKTLSLLKKFLDKKINES